MSWQEVYHDRRVRVAVTLTAIWVVNIWHFRSFNVFLYPLLAVLTVGALDVVLTWLRWRKTYLPAASLVSGLLVGLVIAPSEKWWIIVLAAALASLSKQFIGAGIRQHIFNPAAFGIMAVSLTLGVGVAWWGVAWSKLLLLILAPAMFLILKKLMRLFIPAGFLATYFVYLLTIMAPAEAIETIVDGSVMLFALVMLPEPITSPNWGYFKFAFGILVALVAIVIGKFFALSEVFLPALLVSNLFAFLVLRLKVASKAKASKEEQQKTRAK